MRKRFAVLTPLFVALVGMLAATSGGTASATTAPVPDSPVWDNPSTTVHPAVAPQGDLGLFEGIPGSTFTVQVDSQPPLVLGSEDFNLGLQTAGTHTVTVTPQGQTNPVVTTTVTVPAGGDITGLIYLDSTGKVQFTGFSDPTTPIPVGESEIAYYNTANVGPIDIYRGSTEVASNLANTPTAQPSATETIAQGPVSFTVTTHGGSTSNPLYSQSGLYLQAGVLLNVFVVGDSTVNPSTVQILTNAVPLNIGYRLYASDGGVFDFGDANFYGSEAETKLNAKVVGGTPESIGQGYWLVGADGGVFALGGAPFYGSAETIKLNSPIVGIADTPDDGGYYLVAADGGVFTYGDAHYQGSLGGTKLNKPIVGIKVTPDGGGYWLVASDGGVFAFGDAGFYGSTGSITLNKPIVGIESTVDGLGYWLVASDGGVFSYGDAQFYGSSANLKLNAPIVSLVTTSDSLGYWLVGSDGGVFGYGDAGYYGSMAGKTLNGPVLFGSPPGAALPS